MPPSKIIQQAISTGVLGLLVGIAVLACATALVFLAIWEKRKRSIC